MTETIRQIGLIGGCSAESTAHYYAHINAEVRKARPGHGARILMWSFDFDEINSLIERDDWDAAADKFIHAAQWLKRGGAEAILICTNTMHKIADDVADAVTVPLIHLIDETVSSLRARRLRRPLLLGTRFTMNLPFYRERLIARDLEPVLPQTAERQAVHSVIYDELIEGKITREGKERLESVISNGALAGADCVILGCTELGMVLKDGEAALPVADTTLIHADAAVRFALGAHVA